RARTTVDFSGDRSVARRHPAAGAGDAAAADRRARQAPRHATDRARAIHRQPDGALHLSVCRPADAGSAARHGPTGVRAVHRAAAPGSAGVLSRSSAAMRRLGFFAFVLIASNTAAQEPLQLAALQREALDADPRMREFNLQVEQSGLRVKNIEV